MAFDETSSVTEPSSGDVAPGSPPGDHTDSVMPSEAGGHIPGPANHDATGDDAASSLPAAANAEVSESAAIESPSEPDVPRPEVPYVERPPVELAAPEPEVERNWYILKVQSNREESIRDGLIRRVKVAGLDGFFGDIIVPTETVTEFKNGKKRVVKRKLYPGYIVVNMSITDETWFLVRETPGIGDFTGAAGKPSPMRQQEVEKIVVKEKAVETEAPTLSIAFKPGDRVKINDGTFENFEGEVSAVDATNGRITVMINIFGRSTPVELEYWQVEGV